MPPAEVAALLDYRLTIPVGVRGRAIHHLFFSPPDAQCFVAVQDSEDGAVITVLPIDYHESCAWQVTLAPQEQVNRLLRDGSTYPPERCPDRSARRVSRRLLLHKRARRPSLRQPGLGARGAL